MSCHVILLCYIMLYSIVILYYLPQGPGALRLGHRGDGDQAPRLHEPAGALRDFKDTVNPFFESDTVLLECFAYCFWLLSDSSNRGMSEQSPLTVFLESPRLWGQGTAFEDFTDFARAMEAGGVSAMEMLAINMKAQHN